MAYEVVYTKTFEREYDSVLRYHVEHLCTPQAAQSLMTELDDACVLLAENPELKAISRKPMLEELDLREWPVKNYVIVYRAEGGRLYLEHIFHQSQDFELLV